MDDDFEALLNALRDEELPLPFEDLEKLSDLNRARLTLFLGTWSRLSANRKSLLLSTLGQQADEKIELSFEAINRAVLSEPEADVRRIAISNLWECEDEGLVPTYLQALDDETSTDVRIAAAEALGRYVLLGENAKLSGETLSDIENALISTIASDPQIGLLKASVEALGYSSRPEAVRIIAEAYEAGEESLRGSALIAMGRSYSEQWKPIVMQELLSPSPVLRNEAARAAGELEMREAVGLLIDLLDDASDEVRESAVWSLGLIGGDRARQALLELQEASGPEDPISQVLEDALDHIAFLDGTPDFLMFDFENDDEDDVG
ncbi:MAG: HEAT repeat domain-containing protein [Anaerolineales bacterium]|jgi:HEAT repeat protein